jgi:hypothetical protein
MEPLSLTAAAIATLVLTKALEKTGEKLGEKVMEKGGKLMQQLKHKSPNTEKAIALAPEAPLDYGQAVLEVESVAKSSPELLQALQELVEAAKADPHPQFAQALLEVADTLKSPQPTIQNLAKLAEKINNLNQAENITIHQTNTF